MPDIIDLEMSDEEYLQQIAQGRDPVLEKLYERQLARLQALRKPTSTSAALRPSANKPRLLGILGAITALGLVGVITLCSLGIAMLQSLRMSGEKPRRSQAHPQELHHRPITEGKDWNADVDNALSSTSLLTNNQPTSSAS